MARCSDCGCILEGGICSNCQEELFIITYQNEDISGPLSKEFQDKVIEQKQFLKDHKRFLKEI